MARLAQRALPRRPDRVTMDIALAAIFVVLAQWDVWVGEFGSEVAVAVWGDNTGGPDAISGSALLLTALALAWRRSHPLWSTAAVMAGIAAQAALTGDAPVNLAVTGPALISIYSVAAYGERRDAVVGLALTFTALAIHDLNVPAVESFMDYANQSLFWWLVMLASWISGLFVNRNRRTHTLEEVAARLQRERDEHAEAAAADERARVARELHDIVSHGVSLIALQAGAAQDSLDEGPDRVRERLAAIEGTARAAAVELRRMLAVLRRDGEVAERSPQPGVGELEHLAEQLEMAGVHVSLEVHGSGERLAPGIELSAYRIVQEALTNALKHASPDHVRVVLRYGPTDLEIEVSDDGRARTRAADNGGFGLTGMRERVALHGGRLQTGPRPEGGYVVRAQLPREGS